MATAAMLAGNLKKMKKVTCGHRIPAPVSGKYNRKNGPFRFPDGHKVPSDVVSESHRLTAARPPICGERSREYIVTTWFRGTVWRRVVTV